MQIEISKTLATDLHDILDPYFENPIFTLSHDMVKFLHTLKQISNGEGGGH